MGMNDKGNDMIWLRSYRSILEIKEFAKKERLKKKRSEIRGAVKICVIDDEKFLALNNLKTHGYNIAELQDISRVEEVEEFDIILCDLMGVGRNFDASAGGGSIIREIKKNYPTKFVIAYTGARISSSEAVLAKEHCDEFLRKDADMGEWTDLLDQCVDNLLDPYKMWIYARQELLEIETDIRDVVKLESAYVKSVMDKDEKFSQLSFILKKLDLSGNAKAIIQGIIASKLYIIVFG